MSTSKTTVGVTGTPHVQAVPEWVVRPLAEVAWMEHALLWVYVTRGKSPEVHGARCALAWIRGVHPGAPATADVVAPTHARVTGELIVCGAVANGDPYPDQAWWQKYGLTELDTPARRRWREVWSGYGWTAAIASGAGLGLSWVLGFVDDNPPVLPRHFEDGSRVPAEVRRECAAAVHDVLFRPLPTLGQPGQASA